MFILFRLAALSPLLAPLSSPNFLLCLQFAEAKSRVGPCGADKASWLGPVQLFFVVVVVAGLYIFMLVCFGMLV